MKIRTNLKPLVAAILLCTVSGVHAGNTPAEVKVAPLTPSQIDQHPEVVIADATLRASEHYQDMGAEVTAYSEELGNMLDKVLERISKDIAKLSLDLEELGMLEELSASKNITQEKHSHLVAFEHALNSKLKVTRNELLLLSTIKDKQKSIAKLQESLLNEALINKMLENEYEYD